MEIKYLSVLGLVIIAIGWFMQYFSLSKGKKEIRNVLPAFSALGILCLIVDSYMSGAIDIVVGNVLTFIGSLAVFLSIKSK